jgi:hypothetical protein
VEEITLFHPQPHFYKLFQNIVLAHSKRKEQTSSYNRMEHMSVEDIAIDSFQEIQMVLGYFIFWKNSNEECFK